MATFGDYHLVPMALGLALLGVLVFFSGGLARATWVKERATVKRAVGGALLVYFATSFATSFIEEEHEGWFFASTTLLLLLALR